ncbi:uncharacterized protein LOC119988118 isoform X2 [Tripterygium wilfordii]|uniref:uncharacterized protein LOC119988118 isoform X2 n=1 Tax=Tripterygium wilfordii TaxID=458696 RepID=UPI0018F7E752|nr:uncharacterized protein LOC119988118 isoform X2 [Tripterygium wilfordii]
MHAIKGGWVGQTFAVAKQNESGGKKARIRQSKEGRKTMAEAFIKKYQSLNNGNFPSLSLTQKEVGGSFYTVREIVREIIQENRVLGPAKLAPDAQNTYRLSEQYPLGSIATEPQMSFSESTQGGALIPDHHLGSSEDLVKCSYERSAGLETQGSDSGQIINGNHVIVKDKVSDAGTELKSNETLEVEITSVVAKTTETLDTNEAIVDVSESDASETQEMENTAEGLPTSDATEIMDTDKAVEVFKEFSASDANETLETEKTVETFTASDASEILEVEKTIKESSASDAIETLDTQKTIEEFLVYKANVTQMAEADVVVETFPLRRATKSTDSLGSNPKELAMSLEEKVVQNVDSELVNDFLLSDGISSSENSAYKSSRDSSGPSLDKNSDSVGKKAVEKHPEVEMLGASNGTATIEGSVQYTPVSTNTQIDNLASETQGQGLLTSETMTNSAVNGIQEKNLESTQAAGSSKESTDRESVAIENKVDLFQKKENKADVPCTSSADKQSNPVLDRTKLKSWEKASRSPTEPENNPLWAIFKSFIAAFVKFWSE